MTLSHAEASARVTAPGERFETMPIEIDGIPLTAFRNAPANLRDLFDLSRQHGDADFLVHGTERYSFRAVHAAADGFAAALQDRHGVRPGDRVAIAMRNHPEWIMAYIGALSIGAIVVSMNAWWTADELAYGFRDATPKVLVADPERIDRSRDAAAELGIAIVGVRLPEGSDSPGVDRWEDIVEPGANFERPEIAPDDDATILYTSGTTGAPKGAVSTHRAIIQALLAFSCKGAIDALRRPEPAAADRTVVFILIVPLFHVTGNVPVMLGSLVAGKKLVIMPRWDPGRALELIERERVTQFVGVPTQSWDLLEHPDFDRYDTSSLLSVGGGGAPAPPHLVERVARSFETARPNIGYGMTETNAYGPGNSGADYEANPTSTGRVTPVLEIGAFDPDGNRLPPGELGEIRMRGPMLIRGYWNNPEATAEAIVDGWLRTGDLGRIDDEGFVYLEDRVKDMILRGGENVYSAEVEAAIYEHPAVYEAAVFGVPHERLGEEVAAAIVVRPGATLELEDLRTFLTDRLAGYKIPSRLVTTDTALPRNAAGKILKRDLRERFDAS